MATVIIIALAGMGLFPESRDSMVDLVKAFLSLFAVSLSGAITALLI